MFRHILVFAVLFVVFARERTFESLSRRAEARASHEPNEKRSFKFQYIPNTHDMIMSTNDTCYVIALSDSESTAAHTDIGLRTLEIKLINLLKIANMTEVQKSDLDHHVSHACNHNDKHFYRLTA